MDFRLGGDGLVVSLAAVERQLEEVRSSGSAMSKDPIVELRALRSQLVLQEEAIERAAGEPAEIIPNSRKDMLRFRKAIYSYNF